MLPQRSQYLVNALQSIGRPLTPPDIQTPQALGTNMGADALRAFAQARAQRGQQQMQGILSDPSQPNLGAQFGPTPMAVGTGGDTASPFPQQPQPTGGLPGLAQRIRQGLGVAMPYGPGG